MKDFADEVVSLILADVQPKVDGIMRYMANQIQGDFVAVTYRLLDMYYANYSPEQYIRTDKLKGGLEKNGKKRKNGRYTKTTSAEKARRNDISLRSAMTAMIGGQPAIGIARGDYANGYIAGVCFDESYFDSAMKHSVHGDYFDEMDIVSNFLFSADGDYGYGNIASRSPSAATELENYLNNYDAKIDKYYKDACKKFK